MEEKSGKKEGTNKKNKRRGRDGDCNAEGLSFS